ncbi:hypothetical protein LCGC14_0711600 [marine sediment metagenome]|uniref:Putative regulatory protein FmdB zinc ribbon domain-containing protein n=1 Tax=marine sediment metagenome TaxID=412755 RepID=A0A0F9QEV5_9ZZZZ
MPLYSYHCNEHGNEDVYQGMNDIHKANCPTCGEEMKRIFYPLNLKCDKASMGNTREELFNNLAMDGFAHKDWKDHDSYYKKAKGILD